MGGEQGWEAVLGELRDGCYKQARGQEEGNLALG